MAVRPSFFPVANIGSAVISGGPPTPRSIRNTRVGRAHRLSRRRRDHVAVQRQHADRFFAADCNDALSPGQRPRPTLVRNFFPFPYRRFFFPSFIDFYRRFYDFSGDNGSSKRPLARDTRPRLNVVYSSNIRWCIAICRGNVNTKRPSINRAHPYLSDERCVSVFSVSRRNLLATTVVRDLRVGNSNDVEQNTIEYREFFFIYSKKNHYYFIFVTVSMHHTMFDKI